MNILILSAGIGKRLQPITLDTPKPLIKIGSETILGRLNRQLTSAFPGSRIWVNISYKPESFMEEFSKYHQRCIPSIIWEPRILGGARTLDFLYNISPGPTLVIHGDLVLGEEYVESLRAHLIRMAFSKSIIFCHTRPFRSARSVVEYDTNNFVTRFQERSGLPSTSDETVAVNSGVYFFAMRDFPFKSFKYGSDIASSQVSELISRKTLSTILIEEPRVSIDSHHALSAARASLKDSASEEGS